jgi:hypothetical protein
MGSSASSNRTLRRVPDSAAESKDGPASLLSMASSVRLSTTWGMLIGP